MGRLSVRECTNGSITLISNDSNALASRKNCVTPINKSLYNALTSLASSSSRSMYSLIRRIRFNSIRRWMRRSTVPHLYCSNAMPCWAHKI